MGQPRLVRLDAALSLSVAFTAWRDLAHPQAGGSEVLVDRLARGCQGAGHAVTLLCGGPVGPRPYPVVDLGGAYGQYLRAPAAHARLGRVDVLVDVANGVPFFAPLWRRGPVVCLVHHVHTEQWHQRFPAPVAAVGRMLETRAVPAAYRRQLFVAVSPSTADALAELGVPRERVRVVSNGVDAVEHGQPARSREPLFLALGRLVPHKRIDRLLAMWRDVRKVTGGRLVVAGDGPERAALERLAGEGVEIRGRITEDEKRRLLAEAWLLVHPALHEGWGIVVMEAAAAGTPTLGFDVPGVRDAIVDADTGVLAVDEAAFARSWIDLARDGARRERLGAAARRRAAAFSWERSVARFDAVLQEACHPPYAERQVVVPGWP